MKRIYISLLTSLLLLASGVPNVWGQDANTIRFATFNVSMFRSKAGQLSEELQDDHHAQPKQIAEIIQTVRPDVLLLNEFDYDDDGIAVRFFMENYLGKSQNGKDPMRYAHAFFTTVNTGLDSGVDLDNDGKKTGVKNDAFGYGEYPGQYGMLVLSKFPIDVQALRTFQKFKWKDMPEATWPIMPDTDKSYYSEEAKEVFRLSSKSHWDIPIMVDQKTIHFLVSHPTPPVFDKKEDKNGCRNRDEIRIWADYVTPGKADYLYDDAGVTGGLPEGAHFVIAGDQNADPNDGDSRENAIRLLTQHPLINNGFVPSSDGAAEAAKKTSGANRTHTGDASHDTGDFNDKNVGNLRIDYVLPSKTLNIEGSGVFWPKQSDSQHAIIKASDHRMVWIDVVR